jgi:hypothetical protein
MQKIERFHKAVTRLLHLLQDGLSWRMVLEEGDKTEAALRLVVDDRDLPDRFQIFFKTAKIVHWLRQMMEHIPGEYKVETSFRQVHLTPRSQDRDDIIKPFLYRLVSYEIQILRLHVDRIDSLCRSFLLSRQRRA